MSNAIESQQIAGETVLVVDSTAGPFVRAEDFATLIGDCLGEGATVLALPVEVAGDDFFRLRSGVAGEVLQKFVNYQVRLAIVGDVSRWVQASKAFHDLVVEAERDSDLLFVADMDALAARLERDSTR